MLTVEVVTPEKILYNKDGIKKVVLPIGSGEYEVLPQHSPFIAELTSDVIELEFENDTKDYLVVHSGFVQILNDKVKVVAFIAESKDEIDKMRALDALNRAKERLNNNKYDQLRASRAIKRAEARLKVLDLK